jgi:hypothetical protein
MAPKVKEAMSWASEAVETAFGWAFIACALYTILFVNFTGNGTLWDSMRGVARDSVPAKTRDTAVQVRVVPVRPPDLAQKAQNRMLMIPEVPDQEIKVPVMAGSQFRADDRMTDAPADGKAGKTWKKRLVGSLRTFTVYGRGEQTSSASASVGEAPAPANRGSAPAPTYAAEESAYRVGAAATARPGISDHITPVTSGASDGVRNFR